MNNINDTVSNELSKVLAELNMSPAEAGKLLNEFMDSEPAEAVAALDEWNKEFSSAMKALDQWVKG